MSIRKTTWICALPALTLMLLGNCYAAEGDTAKATAEAAATAPAISSPAPTSGKTAATTAWSTLPGIMPAKRSLSEEDPRLKRTVTLVMRDRPITELLLKLTDLTAIKMASFSDIRDRKVTVIVRGVPVMSVMAQAAIMMGWGWERIITGGEISYRVRPQPGLRRKAQTIRDNIVNASVRDKAKDEWQRIQPTLAVWIAHNGSLNSIRQADPDLAAAIINDTALEYKLQALGAMPEQQRLDWIVDQTHYADEVRGPSVSYAVIQQEMTNKKSKFGSRDPLFTKKIDLKLDDGASLSSSLEALSKAAHINVVADSYSRKTAVRTAEWENVSVNQILNTIADETGYDWSQSGSYVRFRSRTWFVDEIRDVPERLIKPWKDLKAKQGRLKFEDTVGLVAALTNDQLDSLAKSDDENTLREDAVAALNHLAHYRFYGALSTSQRGAAWTEDGLSMARMNPEQKQQFLRLMARDRRLKPPYWEEAIFFYVRQTGTQGYRIAFMFNIENKQAWRQIIALPQPPGAEPELETELEPDTAEAGATDEMSAPAEVATDSAEATPTEEQSTSE